MSSIKRTMKLFCLTGGALQISLQPDWQMDNGVFVQANDGAFSNPEAGCKESHFKSLPFRQADASIY